MAFQTDQQLAEGAAKEFGSYLTTFVSERGHVRADFFRRGKGVTAYVSFPTGLDAGSAGDPYYSNLWNYAREQGFPDQFRVVYIESRVV